MDKNKLYHTFNLLFYILVSLYLLLKAIFLPSLEMTIICSIFLFFLTMLTLYHLVKNFQKSLYLVFLNVGISIIMVELLLGISKGDKSYLAAVLISQTFALEYFEKLHYNKSILLLFYVYLGVRFWESSPDHIVQFLLLLGLLLLKIANLFCQNHKDNNIYSSAKSQMVKYFLKLYPTFTVFIREKKTAKSQNLFNDFPFEVIFANESASKEYGVKDSNSLLKVLENIQLNSNDILNSEQSPNYSPNLKSKKFGKISSYFQGLTIKKPNNLPKYQKFLVTYTKKAHSSMEDLHLSTGISKRQFRVILILFEFNGKLSILMNMEDSNIEDQLKKLKEMDLYKDQMLASITHDLKSPLSSVLTLIGNAKGIVDNEERGKNLDYAIVNGNLLLNLINDILDYSLMKRGKFSLFFTHFTLNQIIDDVIKLMKIQADLKGIELKVDNQLNAETNPSFYSDFRRIKQVLINLIGNALKFTLTGKIIVKVANIDVSNIVKFEVIDTGIGIKEEIIKQLGKPFHSFEHDSNLNYEGVGLGLHICKTIIGQLGPFEKIHISSHLGSGSKFGFLIFLLCDKKNQKFQTANQLDEIKKHPFYLDDFSKGNRLDEEFSVFYSKEFCNSDFDEKKTVIETTNYLFSKNANDLKSYLTSTKLLVTKELRIVKSMSSEKNFDPLQYPVSPKKSPRKSTFFNSKKLVTNETSLSQLVLKKNSKVFRILLVDDDPFQHFIYKGFLKQMKESVFNMNLEWEEAPHGAKAFELFKEKNFMDSTIPYNLIFMDCQMLIQNGYETATLIKKAIREDGFVSCPIVGCSALHGNNEESKCFQAGMDLFVPKPINFENFQDVLISQMKNSVF